MGGFSNNVSIGATRARIKRKLKAVVDKARPAVTEAMAESANDITGIMRNLVPERTGALKDSIDWTFGNPPPTKATGAFRPKSGTNKNGERVAIYAGDDDAYYARWVEFGTAPGISGEKTRDSTGRRRTVKRTHPGSAAQPFFFPAWRAGRKSAKRRIRKAVSAAVKQAVKKT